LWRLSDEYSAIIHGKRKKEICGWWLTLIDSRVTKFLLGLGFRHHPTPSSGKSIASRDILKQISELEKSYDIVKCVVSAPSAALNSFVDNVTNEIYSALTPLITSMEFVSEDEWIEDMHMSETYKRIKEIPYFWNQREREAVKRDLCYLKAMRDLDMKIQRENNDRTLLRVDVSEIVPIAGLIMGRFHLYESECRSALHNMKLSVPSDAGLMFDDFSYTPPNSLSLHSNHDYRLESGEGEERERMRLERQEDEGDYEVPNGSECEEFPEDYRFELEERRTSIDDMVSQPLSSLPLASTLYSRTPPLSPSNSRVSAKGSEMVEFSPSLSSAPSPMVHLSDGDELKPTVNLPLLKRLKAYVPKFAHLLVAQSDEDILSIYDSQIGPNGKRKGKVGRKGPREGKDRESGEKAEAREGEGELEREGEGEGERRWQITCGQIVRDSAESIRSSMPSGGRSSPSRFSFPLMSDVDIPELLTISKSFTLSEDPLLFPSNPSFPYNSLFTSPISDSIDAEFPFDETFDEFGSLERERGKGEGRRERFKVLLKEKTTNIIRKTRGATVTASPASPGSQWRSQPFIESMNELSLSET
jgi:hypothetical protein